MNVLNKGFLWGYCRIIEPAYRVLIGNRRCRKKIKRKYHISRKQKNVVIFGTPNHGNLGDYAIYVAERMLFQRRLPERNVFGVNMTDFQHEISALKKLLKREDLLVLTGGGNLGNQYMDDEKIRRVVIEQFPNNRIVVFPQTMYFTKDTEGATELQKSAAIYNAHKDLWLVARDELSYRTMREEFTCKVRLLPDVVLTWGSLTPTEKKGALLVLRNDVEGVLDKEARTEITEMLVAEYEEVEETDTEIAIGNRTDELEEKLIQKLEQINRAELVVTDRLHGMIMAAIAQTPCIVLSNYNHKVRETYKWIESLDYVIYISELGEVTDAVKRLKKKKNCRFVGEEIEKRYDIFLNEITV